MDKPITYVGLDVHKDTIAVALAETGKRGEVREHGKIANTPTALARLPASWRGWSGVGNGDVVGSLVVARLPCLAAASEDAHING